jgi:hypothetical protein
VDRLVEGVVEIVPDVTINSAWPLVLQRMFGWHAALFSTGNFGVSRIATVTW